MVKPAYRAVKTAFPAIMLSSGKLLFSTFIVANGLAGVAIALEKRQNLPTSCHCYNSVTGSDIEASTEQVCGNFGGVAMGTMIGCNCYCANGCDETDFNIKCGYFNPASAGECISAQEHVCPWDH